MQTKIKRNIEPTVQLSSRGGTYRRYFKRPMDFILSFIAIIVLSPVLLVIGILVKVKLGTPVIFKQRRPGLNEKLFTLYKFRTMTDEKDENGELLQDEKRLTKFGAMLRSTSMDELPELFNILKGDMSIVGPRPLLVQYLELYNEQQRKRHCIRPGLTDLSALRGRNNVPWEEQFQHDLEYIREMSFFLDVKIILLTCIKVLERKGVSQEGHATREVFKGNE